MAGLIKLILIGGGAVFALMAYACCRVAGDADRREEQLWIQKKDGEDPEPVWNEDDKRYSGLLEEDEA